MDASLIWSPDVLSVVASHLQPNNVTLLRLVNRATASLFSQHDKIHLAEPVPSWAFTQHWTQPGACRALSRDKRHQLTTSIATVGAVANLKAALAAAGLEPRDDQLKAAAKGGYLRTCLWLTEPGRLREEVDWAVLLISSAESGQRTICKWCLKHLGQGPEGVRPSTLRHAANAAASGGHVELMEWLLQLVPQPMSWGLFYLIRSALQGCDLRTVLSLCRYGPQHSLENLADMRPGKSWRGLLRAALKSPKDWRAKAEWVLVQAAELGVPASTGPLGGHVSSLYQAALEPHPGQGPEAAVERLEWLTTQGCPPTREALDDALDRGNVPGLRWLLGEGIVVVEAGERYVGSNLHPAATQGRLDILQAMREVVDFPPYLWSLVVRGALEGAQLAVLHWAADRLSPDELGGALEWAASTAVSSGCFQTMRWALDHGATLTEDAWLAAVGSGAEAVVEFLAEMGCPKPLTGEPYDHAVEIGAWHMLPALSRAGVPLGSRLNHLCAFCMRKGAPAAVRQWFEAAAGVDPRVAAVAAYEEDEAEEEARATAGGAAVEEAGLMEDLVWAKVERRRRKRGAGRGR